MSMLPAFGRTTPSPPATSHVRWTPTGLRLFRPRRTCPLASARRSKTRQNPPARLTTAAFPPIRLLTGPLATTASSNEPSCPALGQTSRTREKRHAPLGIRPMSTTPLERYGRLVNRRNEFSGYLPSILRVFCRIQVAFAFLLKRREIRFQYSHWFCRLRGACRHCRNRRTDSHMLEGCCVAYDAAVDACETIQQQGGLAATSTLVANRSSAANRRRHWLFGRMAAQRMRFSSSGSARSIVGEVELQGGAGPGLRWKGSSTSRSICRRVQVVGSLAALRW